MSLRNPLFIFVLFAVIALTTCSPANDAKKEGTPEPVKSPAPSATRSGGELGDRSATPTPAAQNEAKLLRPLIERYCTAMRAKDEAVLRSVYSRASIKSMEADMRREGINTLVEFLSSEPVGAKCSVSNERIQGAVGEALVRTETYPNGVTLKFVMEQNEWKMTNQSSDFDAVRNQRG